MIDHGEPWTYDTINRRILDRFGEPVCPLEFEVGTRIAACVNELRGVPIPAKPVAIYVDCVYNMKVIDPCLLERLPDGSAVLHPTMESRRRGSQPEFAGDGI